MHRSVNECRKRERNNFEEMKIKTEVGMNHRLERINFFSFLWTERIWKKEELILLARLTQVKKKKGGGISPES